mmetsp:Transcript_37485/g.107088  ORF Transcript_37485/g.107088 Transcript_37485/m.107088 type:complete len:231 (-) Transcript_37485:431-1123(-)
MMAFSSNAGRSSISSSSSSSLSSFSAFWSGLSFSSCPFFPSIPSFSFFPSFSSLAPFTSFPSFSSLPSFFSVPSFSSFPSFSFLPFLSSFLSSLCSSFAFSSSPSFTSPLLLSAFCFFFFAGFSFQKRALRSLDRAARNLTVRSSWPTPVTVVDRGLRVASALCSRTAKRPQANSGERVSNSSLSLNTFGGAPSCSFGLESSTMRRSSTMVVSCRRPACSTKAFASARCS